MHELRRAVAMLGLRPAWVIRAVVLGATTLMASVGLSAVSAWLIVRASQMPPVMYLNLAAASVRGLGVTRGVSRYLDRLAAHDVALRGVVTLRTTVYAKLATGRTEVLAGLRRGDLLARTGVDVDDVGDVVVRALVPGAVAVVVSLFSVAIVGAFSPMSGVVLAACLAVSGIAVPLLSVRREQRIEAERVAARTAVATLSTHLIDRAAELAVSGRREGILTDLASAQRRVDAAERVAARPVAASAAVAVLATGAAVLGCLLVAIPALVAGTLSATELGVVALVPLAAFEATAPLPAAATQLRRSQEAAARIMALLDAAQAPAAEGAAAAGIEGGRPHAPGSVGLAGPAGEQAGLVATGVDCGWPGGPVVVTGLGLTLAPGRSVAIVGPSGVGKTTLLLTLAGLLPARAGVVRVDGTDPYGLRGSDRAEHLALTAEDAHVFSTSVLENLRAARGDVTEPEARLALGRAGLGSWLESLPDGLHTALAGDSLSGGERRRLLIARALVSPAPILLLDEPAEHLEPAVADALVRDLLTRRDDRAVVVVTHHTSALDAADEVLVLGRPATPEGLAHGGAALLEGSAAVAATVMQRGRWQDIRPRLGESAPDLHGERAS